MSKTSMLKKVKRKGTDQMKKSMNIVICNQMVFFQSSVDENVRLNLI